MEEINKGQGTTEAFASVNLTEENKRILIKASK